MPIAENEKITASLEVEYRGNISALYATIKGKVPPSKSPVNI